MTDGRKAAERITVSTPGRTYEVIVGRGLLEALDTELGALARGRSWRRAFVLTDENVGRLYMEPVASALGRLGLDVSEMSIRPGESSKNMELTLGVVEAMIARGLSRSDLVVALGGGVVGDLGGFAAAVFKRGIDILQLPTTLMSQVDSAIGGKTGVNLAEGKNLVGAFHQPVAVVSDVEALGSLPAREYRAGLAEVAKYRFLRPRAFERAEASPDALASGDTSSLLTAVSACASIKARIVSADERETAGIRITLNYGHTLGHALEAAVGYEGVYTHGEAVAAGMVFAALVSDALGLSEGLAPRHRLALGELGLPAGLSERQPGFGELEQYMARDKKSSGSVRMVLLEKEGSPVVRDGIPVSLLSDCYERLREGT